MTLKRKGRRTSGQKSKRFKSQAVIEITEVAKSERAASAEKESAKPERAALAEIIKSCSKKKKLPEAEHLHKLYVEDKDKSERNVVEDACKHIASRLEKIDGVIEARIGYREEDLVCHCVVDKDVKIPDEFEGYTIECNHISEFNKEDKAVLDKERQNSQLIPTVSEDLLKIINEKRDSLMKNHSNLIGISFSMHKSKLYEKRGKHTCDDKPCVVFNVKGKGVIPLYEEMLPSHLGSFDTDVRNSYFVRKVGGSPRDLHIDIKIGCKISTDTGSGTIGGFVEHKSVPMAITCAHVILDNDELGRLKKDPKKVPWGKRCYQPSKNGSNMIGTLHSATYNKYVDVAFVKLDPSRLPTQGVFPDVKDKTECSNPCNHCYGIANKLYYNTGEVIRPEDVSKESVIIKYGYKTGFTRGHISQRSTSVRFGELMKNQIEVVSDDIFPFSKSGDSGSLVFSVDGNKRVRAIGILVGGSQGRDYVTPVTEILKSIGMQKPYFLKPFHPIMQYLKK